MKKYKVRAGSVADVLTAKEFWLLVPVALLVGLWINGGL